MNFDFEKMADGGFEVVFDNSLTEHFIRKFPDAAHSREKSIWTVVTPRGDNVNNQQLMNHVHEVRNASNIAGEDCPIYIYSAGGNCEAYVPTWMTNEFLTAVPCATFSLRLSAWYLPDGGDDTLAKLDKFKWFASE